MVNLITFSTESLMSGTVAVAGLSTHFNGTVVLNVSACFGLAGHLNLILGWFSPQLIHLGFFLAGSHLCVG